MYDKGLLVAYYVYMPFYYKKKGEKFIAALGFDSMVKKEYRDFLLFMRRKGLVGLVSEA